MSHLKTVVVFSSCMIFVASISIQAQDRIGPGSTIRGDELRGEGVFLRGAGIYNLYSAKGRSIDADTSIKIQRWNMQVYQSYMQERASRIGYKKNLKNKVQNAIMQKAMDKEKRLRTNPDPDDVLTGEALNALVIDLSNPSIQPTKWWDAPVKLPDGITVRSLTFRVPKVGDKSATKLSGKVIALGRLDPARWPSFIPKEMVGVEREAYVNSYRELLKQCADQNEDALKFETLNKLDANLRALKAKVNTAIPVERDYRATALKYVDGMEVATKIFDATTIDFVKEMIQDTETYSPETVGELLGFLRKYRLFFASAEGRPKEGEVYRQLFESMLEQKVKLKLPMLPPDLEPPPPPEELKLQGMWVLTKLRRYGKDEPGSADPAKRSWLRINGEAYAQGVGPATKHSGKLKVDASKTPRVFDRSGVNFEKKFVNAYGVYDLTDDILRICSSPSQRPTDFRAPPGTDRVTQWWARFQP